MKLPKLIFALALPLWGRYELVTPQRTAAIVVSTDATQAVRLAVADFTSDVRKITGKTLRVVDRMEKCGKPCLIIETVPNGKWESYRVVTSSPELLRISGSDERGTMFGIYAFIERYLDVDPLYFWTDREPTKRNTLAWDSVSIEGREPTFRYRGWFINDEDLLTEWKDGGGKRDIDYPFYHQVTAPEVLEYVFEAMLRLQHNLVIPASFTDIENPNEERMIRAATRRGLFISMHHVEPMGVSGFAFKNFWKSKGREMPYSFIGQRDAFQEIWTHYAARWAHHPNVIWQTGLRGIGDRPVWAHDAQAPTTDEGRGKMISDALEMQAKIVRSVNKRPNPPMTTTLWMEGALLNKQGHLKFPPGVGIIFADNTPGWRWQSDFFETKREPGQHYGVYYHHALWGSGPHLAQAVPPRKTHEMFAAAVHKGDTWYAILNVSNVREFALGLDASANMLRDFNGFEPERYLSEWCRTRFGRGAEVARRAYEEFFAAYVLNAAGSSPILLDGLALHDGEGLYGKLLNPPKSAPTKASTPGFEAGAFQRLMPDLVRPGINDVPTLLAQVRKQMSAMVKSRTLAQQAASSMTAEERTFFENNLIAQQTIMIGILRWLETGALATLAERNHDRAEVLIQARAGLLAIGEIRTGQAMASRGKWQEWYRGDRKMNLARAAQLTQQLVERSEKGTKQ